MSAIKNSFFAIFCWLIGVQFEMGLTLTWADEIKSESVTASLPAAPKVSRALAEYASLSLPAALKGQKSEAIPGLYFTNPGKVLVEKETAVGRKPRLVAKIMGTFARAGPRILSVSDYSDRLVWGDSPGTGSFVLTVPVLLERNVVKLKTRDSSGKIESQTILLNYKRRLKPSRSSIWAEANPTISLGLMVFNYDENYRVNPLAVKASALLTTLKVSHTWALNSALQLGFSGFYTPLMLSNSITGSEFKVLRLNLSLGYALPKFVAPWRFTLGLGMNYTAMMVANNAYGYKNAVGLQVGALLQKNLSPRDTLYSSFKFSLFPTSTFGITLGNREYALEIGWLRPFGNQHTLSVGFEVLNFLATVQTVSQGVSDSRYLGSTSFGLSASYGF